MKPIRIVAWAVIAVMVGAIIYGFAAGDFGDNASTIWSVPWGKVSLIDLYAGLVIFGAWVAYRESNVVVTALWWILLLTLGNLAAGGYLLLVAIRSSDVNEMLTGEKAIG